MSAHSTSLTNTSTGEQPQPADTIENAHWYLIYTKPRQEYRAQENLKQQGFEVYLPLHQSERLLRGKLRVIEEPLFKRYVFVRFNSHNSPWHTIRSTLGVSELVRTGGQPAKVPPALIQALMQQAVTTQAMFERGDQLRITSGPFHDLQAVFEMQDGEQRAIVLIELLNKIQKITVNLNALSKAD